MSLITTIPVSDFLQSSDVAGMQAILENALSSEILLPENNVNQNFTVLWDDSGAEIYNLTSIGSYAFANSYKTGLSIGNSVTSIGNYAFGYCSGFTGDLVIGDGVTSIGSYAFQYCSGFTGSLTIGNSVTSIGDGAFSYCSGLTTVYSNVNASVVASNAFNASGITTIYYKSGTTGWTNPWNGIATAVWTSWPDPMP
jgi:hypothetical protein